MISPELSLRIFLVSVWVLVFLYTLRSIWVSVKRKQIKEVLAESIERINLYGRRDIDLSVIDGLLGDRQKWINRFWVFNPFKLVDDLPTIRIVMGESIRIAKENNL